MVLASAVILVDLQAVAMRFGARKPRGLVDRAFQRLAQAVDEEALIGRPLADWLDDTAAQTLLHKAQEQGIMHSPRVSLRRNDGTRQIANVSAALLAERDRAGVGFILQPVVHESGPGP